MYSVQQSQLPSGNQAQRGNRFFFVFFLTNSTWYSDQCFPLSLDEDPEYVSNGHKGYYIYTHTSVLKRTIVYGRKLFLSRAVIDAMESLGKWVQRVGSMASYAIYRAWYKLLYGLRFTSMYHVVFPSPAAAQRTASSNGYSSTTNSQQQSG